VDTCPPAPARSNVPGPGMYSRMYIGLGALLLIIIILILVL